jgi:hypothetical protein
MNSEKAVPRRAFIIGGSASLLSVATAAGLRGESSAASVAQSLAGGGRSVTLTAATDPSFGASLDSLFPGLRVDPNFEIIEPLTVLVTNQSSVGIRAFTVTWTLSTASDKVQRSEFYYYASGMKRIISAQAEYLQGGQTRLVSPFFSLRPQDFKATPKISWGSVLSRGEFQKFVESILPDLVTVDICLDAAVFQDWQLVGPDTANLAKNLRVRRNGEHDEAVSLHKFLKTNPDVTAVESKLMVDQTVDGAAGHTVLNMNIFSQLYWQARTRMAAVLLKRMSGNITAQFLSDLAKLRNCRRTIIQKMAS